MAHLLVYALFTIFIVWEDVRYIVYIQPIGIGPMGRDFDQTHTREQGNELNNAPLRREGKQAVQVQNRYHVSG